jgi:hypothetical protein
MKTYALCSLGVLLVLFSGVSILTALDRPPMMPMERYCTPGDPPSTFNPPEKNHPFVTVFPDSGAASLVDSLVDYGGQNSSPTNYPNARHCEHNQFAGFPLVGYERGANTDNDVVYCKWNAFGFWEPPMTISDQENDAGRIGFAMNQDNGTLYAVWHQTDDGALYYVRYAHLPAGSTEWSGHATLSLEGVQSTFPTIDLTPDGVVWVCWEDDANKEVTVTHSTDSGMTWDDPVNIPGGPWDYESWQLPALFCSNDGKVHIAFENYEDGDQTQDVMYTWRDPDTGDWSTPEAAALAEPGANHLWTASLVVDSQEEVHIAGLQNYGWGSNSGNIGTIKHIHGFSGDWTVDTPFLGQNEEAWMDSFSCYPTIGIDPSDNLYLCYSMVDTVIEQTAVTGLWVSTKGAGAAEWDPLVRMTEKDEKDVIYPEIVMHIANGDGDPLVGGGIVWGSMIAAQQPSSVYYMYMGRIFDDIDISGLRAEVIDGAVRVSWHGNDYSYRYYVHRSNEVDGEYVRLNSEPLKECSFFDDTVQAGHLYFYRISVLKGDNRESEPFGLTSVQLSEVPPSRNPVLKENVPNPFNPSTKITFSIPTQTRTLLKIYNSRGELIRTLTDEIRAAGTHTVLWDGRDNAGRMISSGVYYSRLEAGSHTDVKKMVCIK